MDDPHLARRAASGDAAAFDALVRLHQGRIRAFLRRLTKADAALADDLAQETFLEAWRKIAQYRGDAPFAAWLSRIAWSRFLMQARSRGPQTEELDESLPAPIAAPPGERLDLERAMAKLPAPERAALTLCYAMEFSHGEASEIMNLPLGTVKSHVSRGRERLRALLQLPEGEAA
jgi:RNA polymerase sigma-70 factor (ECF subfamily)